MEAAMDKYRRLTATAAQTVLEFYETRRQLSKSGNASTPSTAARQ
jgi:hypothetical protein